MTEMFNSPWMWAGIAVFVLAGCLAVEFVLRAVVNRYGTAREHYPHRVANQLPRVLHQVGRDEMLVQEEDVEKARD